MSRHILILVENLSVPFDRRVWQEARALTAAGFTVTVICPVGAGQDRERETTIDGIRILRYPLRAATGGPLGYHPDDEATRLAAGDLSAEVASRRGGDEHSAMSPLRGFRVFGHAVQGLTALAT